MYIYIESIIAVSLVVSLKMEGVVKWRGLKSQGPLYMYIEGGTLKAGNQKLIKYGSHTCQQSLWSQLVRAVIIINGVSDSLGGDKIGLHCVSCTAED